jgi:hypothetical protein
MVTVVVERSSVGKVSYKIFIDHQLYNEIKYPDILFHLTATITIWNG